MHTEIERLELLVRDMKLDHGAEVQALTSDLHLVRETEQRLRRQLAAAQVLIAGLERRAVEHGKVVAELSAKAADVASERAANAALTAEIDAYRKPPCQQCGAMTHDEATSRCMGRATTGGCDGTDLWPA